MRCSQKNESMRNGPSSFTGVQLSSRDQDPPITLASLKTRQEQLFFCEFCVGVGAGSLYDARWVLQAGFVSAKSLHPARAKKIGLWKPGKTSYVFHRSPQAPTTSNKTNNSSRTK